NRGLYHVHQAAHSAHEIALLNEFRGPVSAADLKQRFAWSLQERGKDIVIVGTPTDEVEKLFFQKVAVTLDSQTRLPKTVRFQEANPQAQPKDLAVVISPRREPPRFLPDGTVRPLQFASREQPARRGDSPVRVVEHVTLLPVRERALPE